MEKDRLSEKEQKLISLKGRKAAAQAPRFLMTGCVLGFAIIWMDKVKILSVPAYVIDFFIVVIVWCGLMASIAFRNSSTTYLSIIDKLRDQTKGGAS